VTVAKQQTDEILSRPILELKDFSISDPETERIYNITREAIERFNAYVEDFFQTRYIITEQIEALNHLNDREKLEEHTESLEQVVMRIDEIRTAMEELALQMGSFVNLRFE